MATKAKRTGASRVRAPVLVAILAYMSTALMGCAFMDTLDSIIRWFPTIGYPTTITTTTIPGAATTTVTTVPTTVTTVTTVTTTTATSTTATSTTATSTTTVTTTLTSTTTTTTPIPEATINGEFDTTVNDPQGFVNDPDVEAAMIEAIANVTNVSEDQVEVEMEVVPNTSMMVSFLQLRRLGTGTVRVTYEIRVPEMNGTDGGDGGDGSSGGGSGSGGGSSGGGSGNGGGSNGGGRGPVVRVSPANVQKKLQDVSKTSLQQKIVQKIQARKRNNGLVNPFTVAVARKTNPRVIHPWATRRTSTGTTTAIPITTTGTTTLHPTVAKNQTGDASFLMKASFGPTRASLAEIGGMGSHEEWVRAQMAMPVGSLREYYRERVSGKLSTANSAAGPRPACEKGSRWVNVVFKSQDVGKEVTVSGGKIYIAGVHVSDIDPSYTGNMMSPPITCDNVIPSYWGWQGKDCANHARVHVVPQNCFQGQRADWDDRRAPPPPRPGR